MQEFIDQIAESNEQHKDMIDVRIKRDDKDYNTFLDYLTERNPFASQNEESLRNIETGALADNQVNVDSAKNIGELIIADMEGKAVIDYTLKKRIRR